MLRGMLLEVLGLGVIVTAFMHLSGSTAGWIGVGAGCLIALVGTSLWHSLPRRALVANLAGLIVLVAALIPGLRSSGVHVWIATVCGVVTWAIGWRLVAAESGGPWRLKDRPVY